MNSTKNLVEMKKICDLLFNKLHVSLKTTKLFLLSEEKKFLSVTKILFELLHKKKLFIQQNIFVVFKAEFL